MNVSKTMLVTNTKIW